MVILSKIKALFANTDKLLAGLKWTIRIALLVLLVRLSFFSNKVVQTNYVERDARVDTMVVVDYKLIYLSKQDSVHTIYRYEKINSVDTISDDSVTRYISDFISKEIKK